ncbi:MAG: dephospho-CoA kinase [Verrucomicrobia bacterium]|nr:dephospho-CoA kinase [Verrucomicrobiota bacterium]
MEQLIQVGLTGGIATGKTTVAGMFARLGAMIIDTDALAHRAIEAGAPAYDAVIEAFGRGIVDAGGAINRARLGEIVFADDPQRQRLNAIVHPAVRAAWTAEVEDLRRRGWRGVVMIVVPLLFEVGLEKQVDAVVTVACSEATQRDRLRERGLSDAQADARIRAQWPVAVKMEKADFAIWNESTMSVLEQQAARAWDRISAPAGVSKPI